MIEVKRDKILHSDQSVVEDIAVVLFLSSTLFALSEMSGFLTSSLTILDYPFSSIIPMFMVLFSLLGFMGTLTSSKMNIIIALIAIGFDLLIQCILLIITPSLTIFIPSLTIILLLSSILVCGMIVLNQLQHSYVSATTHKLEGIKETEFAIEVKNLTRKYNLGLGLEVFALRNVNLQIRKGDFIAIMGPSGSGKSTLLNCLGALDRASSGEIYIDGIEISSLDDEGLAWLRNRKIGFIFQAYNLINRSTVGENVEVPSLVTPLSPEERKMKARKLLHTLGIGDKYDRRPKTLSGGEQQRVAIARALMNDPTILLADEPTGNLDSRSGLVIMDLLQNLNRDLGVTIIVVTHDPEIANMSHRIYYLKDGTNAGIKENIKL
ncbi:ABC transporter ATP-binding protein [Candidatus Hodarchaeum mangrovi]